MAAGGLREPEQSRAPVWLWVLPALYLLVALSAWLPAGWRATDLPVPFVAYLWLRSTFECLIFLWAARRLALGSRLRRSLQITAGAFGVGASAYLWVFLAALSWVSPMPSSALTVVGFLTYLLGLLGILWMPTLTTGRAAWWVFVLDYSTAILGMAAVLAIVITLPQMAAVADASSRFTTLGNGGAQTLMLVGLNALVLRGVARPSRRAFWLFVTMVFMNLIVATVAQLEVSANPAATYPISDLMTALTSSCVVWVAVAFRRDPILPADTAPGPHWFGLFNPLPMLATAAVASLLIYATFVPGSWNVALLAPIMVAQVALLLTRVFLTSRENSRLRQAEAEREARLQHEKAVAVRRLAGGVAHWYNNLLTVVLGHAELASLADDVDPTIRRDLAMIRVAGGRAGRLTDQLLSYSGGNVVRRALFDLGGLAGHLRARAEQLLQVGVTIEVTVPSEPLWVRADQSRIESAVSELIDNAVAAMPSGGRVHLEITTESVVVPIESGPLRIGAGVHAVVAVSDTGVGVTAETLAVMFDPFFTTRPFTQAAGLGLAEVYGVVAAHEGGVVVHTVPGGGTRVALYMPVVEPSAGASVTHY